MKPKNLHRCLELLRSNDSQRSPIIAVVNVVSSLIARESDGVLYLNVGREVGVASTKSFTAQIIATTLIGLWFSQQRQTQLSPLCLQYLSNFRDLSKKIDHVLCEQIAKIRQLASQLTSTQHMFILGRNLMKPIADEGSLKMKEIGYLHSEGYAGGALNIALCAN